MTRRPIWPKVPPRFTAAVLASHSVIALALSALIYLVCLTGTVSVLVDELKLVEQPAPAAAAPRPGALNRAVAEVAAKAAPGSTIYALSPVTPRQRLSVSASGPGGERDFVADADGRAFPLRDPFTDFVTELHMTLTASTPWGSLIVGLSGAALLALILSGVLSHPRIFRDAFRLRLDGSPRLREAELHNRLSVWGLPFHIVVSLTGAVFGLSSLLVLPVATLGFHGDTARVYAPITGPQVPADASPMALPDLEALSARARAVIPGARLYYVGIERPGTRGSRITVEVTAPGRLPRGEDIYFDGQGREVGRGRSVTGPVGLQAYSAAAQLHFGFFGGLPVRLAYVVLGAALTFISASGVTIWLARRQDRGRPAPRLRAAWMAWTFGTPLALLLAALASPIAPVPWVFWSAVAAAQAIGQARAGR